MTKLERQLAGYRLTTAQIDYWRLDHPNRYSNSFGSSWISRLNSRFSQNF